MTQQKTIPGYTYGTGEAARSPVTLDELARLKESVLFGPADEAALREAGQVLADQVQDVLDVWYGFVLAHPFLVAYFSTPDGQLIDDYQRRVRARFGQWILDTCNRPYDQAWLDYAEEIGLRHTAAKKNTTDDAPSVPLINLRYLIAFIVPITVTIRPFLARKGHGPDEVEAMYQAWFKAVALQAALWSRPYTGGDAW
ncbi:protoglobin domain-containing protein [Catellatospora sichuanensis]|uniref:protoglobin domain-containing protein n=1 Tax=Catellatospora sichuanensis TaxID=1969805 RepID=UPI0011830AE4|nr:protoglobin domain-containing protein [Catellatospora sichuanensis]